ncbi:hypothetical protein GUJ93_ZPchr0010g7373 [Zizania palustris]|uniref:ATP synthase F1 complex delta/epsilon subunit N-terminal domain-containing protein n=1 Tax=Zizania palustris TaxID=103762 RepID=A0A8J6BRE7_ZIZPA|nr:hypothetical protein GUJ93_ZPchr0010g7373 [Zizania palustris]
MKLNLYVLTPKRIIWDCEVKEIILSTNSGQIGVLPNHAPINTAVDMGPLRIRHHPDFCDAIQVAEPDPNNADWVMDSSNNEYYADYEMGVVPLDRPGLRVEVANGDKIASVGLIRNFTI